jgi:TolA-binding protein
MRSVRTLVSPVLALALLVCVERPAAAQLDVVTRADIQRLEDTVQDASGAIAQLQSRDRTEASRLQAELDDARDEVTYLSVKLRKNEAVSRSEYTDLRDRIENIANRARSDSAARSVPPRSSSIDDPSPDNEVPAGTELDVRLQNSLSSKTAQVEDRFEATTIVDLRKGDRVLVPAGSVVRGIVTSVNKAGRVERKGSMTVAFDRITIRGHSYPIHATVTQALESEGIKGEIGKIGAGAGLGAIIGGIIGGGKGALAGILIGGGGVVAATEGKDVELPAGSVLRVRLDTPITVP